jgi:hypothetical protein
MNRSVENVVKKSASRRDVTRLATTYKSCIPNGMLFNRAIIISTERFIPDGMKQHKVHLVIPVCFIYSLSILTFYFYDLQQSLR